MTDPNWANIIRQSGYHTVAFSPFAQRHGAWHWYAGFNEIHNTGGGGSETADEISPQVIEWFERKGKSDTPFFMWVNVWDPHTPYRSPADYENPFKNDPIPAWYTEEVRQDHWKKAGPHSAQEVNGFDPKPAWMFENQAKKYPTILDLQPVTIDSMDEARKMFDGYDMGVSYADIHVGKIVQSLKDQGLYENTAIIISSDHGENLGELWVYGDHQTADQFTHRLPMIFRWPGVTDVYAGEEDDRLLYNFDIAATTLELLGKDIPKSWDGQSFASDLNAGNKGKSHRESLVLSQVAWCAQRSARWDKYICIQSYHDGFHDYPDFMVFDLEADPHEQYDLSSSRPDLVDKGKVLLHEWHSYNMSIATHPVDPLNTVMAEGGPLHVKGEGPAYMERLRATGRSEVADRLAKKHNL
jgi:arylsulfatase A-like enzyme